MVVRTLIMEAQIPMLAALIQMQDRPMPENQAQAKPITTENLQDKAVIPLRVVMPQDLSMHQM